MFNVSLYLLYARFSIDDVDDDDDDGWFMYSGDFMIVEVELLTA